MARYLPHSFTREQCRVSCPQFPRCTHGTPGTMGPGTFCAKTVAFSDSGFPTEARVTSNRLES